MLVLAVNDSAPELRKSLLARVFHNSPRALPGVLIHHTQPMKATAAEATTTRPRSLAARVDVAHHRKTAACSTAPRLSPRQRASEEVAERRHHVGANVAGAMVDTTGARFDAD